MKLVSHQDITASFRRCIDAPNIERDGFHATAPPLGAVLHDFSKESIELPSATLIAIQSCVCQTEKRIVTMR
jgi:hypothetical protein